jgi:hypothetical protein
MALIAFVMAVAAMAIGASSASATRVTPAAAAVTGKLVAGTTSKFMPRNAFEETSVQCEESEATSTTPTEVAGSLNNMNRGPAEGEVGPFSTGPGSVLMVFSKPPSFKKCAVYVRSGGAWVNSGIGAVVTTSETNGSWTFAPLGRNVEKVEVDEASFGVPKAGASIEIPELGCTEVVSPAEATSVAAPSYNNTAKRLTVDGQINSNGGCGLPSPAQFEALYEFNAGFEIHP